MEVLDIRLRLYGEHVDEWVMVAVSRNRRFDNGEAAPFEQILELASHVIRKKLNAAVVANAASVAFFVDDLFTLANLYRNKKQPAGRQHALETQECFLALLFRHMEKGRHCPNTIKLTRRELELAHVHFDHSYLWRAFGSHRHETHPKDRWR